MVRFNSDVVFVDTSGSVRASDGSLTLRADDLGTSDIIVGSGESLRPEVNCQIDLGRDYLRWDTLYACSGNFTARPTVNGSGVLLQGEASTSTATDSSGLCAVVNFTTSAGTDFLLTHSLGTQYWNWSLWKTDETPIKAIIPYEISPSGDNLVRIKLDTAMNGRVILNACGASGVATSFSSNATFLLKDYTNDGSSFSNARKLSATSGIRIADQGAQSTSGIVVSLDIDAQPTSGQLLFWNANRLDWQNDTKYIRLTSDFTTTSATAVNVTELSFAPKANKTYLIQAWLLTRTATATVGPRPGVSWPTGATDGVCHIRQTSAAGTNVLQNGNINASVLAPVGGVPNTTQSWPAIIESILVTGSSPAGNFQVQLASETAGTTVTIKAGSILSYREISYDRI